MFVIENDITPPSARAKYPFTTMEVGESCFFPGESTSSIIYIAALVCGKRKGWKFSGRKVEGGLRIWRIA